MGSKKAPKTPTPSPAPTVVQSGGQESQAAEQEERRRLQSQNGRAKTVLAGDVSQTSKGRTLLGGL